MAGVDEVAPVGTPAGEADGLGELGRGDGAAEHAASVATTAMTTPTVAAATAVAAARTGRCGTARR